MINRHIIAAVNQDIAVIVCFVHEIGMFYKRKERELTHLFIGAGRRQIQPIGAIAQQWLLGKYGKNAYWTVRAAERLNSEFSKGGQVGIPEVYYDTDLSGYLAFDWAQGGIRCPIASLTGWGTTARKSALRHYRSR